MEFKDLLLGELFTLSFCPESSGYFQKIGRYTAMYFQKDLKGEYTPKCATNFSSEDEVNRYFPWNHNMDVMVPDFLPENI